MARGGCPHRVDRDRLRAAGRGASAKATEANQARVANAELATDVAALQRELDLIQRPAFIEQQAHALGLGRQRITPSPSPRTRHRWRTTRRARPRSVSERRPQNPRRSTHGSSCCSRTDPGALIAAGGEGAARARPDAHGRRVPDRTMTSPWTTPELTSTGRIEMHSVPHADRLPLDGEWRFQLAASPDTKPAEDPSAWTTIAVPGAWNMQQAGQDFGDLPHYTNVQMPLPGPATAHSRPQPDRPLPRGFPSPAGGVERASRRAPRRGRRERPHRHASTAARSGSARTRIWPRSSTSPPTSAPARTRST